MITHDFPTLHRQVVFGQSGGKIIWQPRIGCWYTDKLFTGEGLPAPYTGMSLFELYQSLDCSDRLYEFGSCYRRVEHPDVNVTRRDLDALTIEHTVHTPAGNQVEILRKSPNNSWHVYLKRLVTTEDELRVATWREEHTTWEWDQEQYDRLLEQAGDLGAPTICLPRMNIQALYLELMGVENALYALNDWPATIDGYFRALEESHDRLIAIVNPSPIEIINFGENIHSATCSPKLFRQYHLPACQRRCEKLHRAHKFVYSHWDGNCKPLLPYARETGLDGIEAITPQPQGDVTLEEVRAALGDRMFLLDGIPAVYFDHTFGEDVMVACAQRLIELFAPRLVLGISDEISSTGDIERIRVVGKIVDAYNARCP